MNDLKIILTSMALTVFASSASANNYHQIKLPTQYSYAHFAPPCGVNGCTFYSGTLIKNMFPTLSDQHIPSSNTGVSSVVKLLKSKNVPLTKNNLNAFFVDSK